MMDIHQTCMWLYHCDRLMIYMMFGDLDLIFQGHSLINGISFEPVDGFSPNLHRYIIVTSLEAD